MKTLKARVSIFLLFILLLNGCAVLDKYSISSTSIDLTRFEDQGIFVTTGDLSQKYKSISILVVNCYDGFSPKSDSMKNGGNRKEENQRFDNIYLEGPTSFDKVKDFDYKLCSLDNLFAELINQAKNVGANGIIKLEIRNITKSGITTKTTQKGIEIVGLAIKIGE